VSIADTHEPDPVPNDCPAVWSLVISDMQARDREGRRKYGTPLQTFNGRDALVDAYQEALDLVVYLRQAIEERAPAPSAHADTIEHPCGCYAPDGDVCWKHAAPSAPAMRRCEQP